MPKPRRSLIIALLASLMFSLSVGASPIEDDRYQVIIDRNAFGLRPIPEPAPEPEPTNNVPPPTPTNIKLAGLSIIGSSVKAAFVIPVTPGQNTNELHFTMRAGEKRDLLEVLNIDVESETVDILNAGKPITLNFDEHGLTAAVVAPSPARGRGAVARPGQAVPPRPGLRPTTPGARTVSATQLGNRNVASAGQSSVRPPTRPTYTVGPGGVTRSRPTAAQIPTDIPARQIRSTAPQPPPQIDPNLQRAIVQEERAALNAVGVPYPPMPPGLD